MLRLYNTAKVFVSYLMNYEDLNIETDLKTADKTLSFTYLSPGVLQNEYYIETESDRFVVKELHPGVEGTDVVCQLDLEALEADVIDKFTAENTTIQLMANAALAGTGWTAVVDEDVASKIRSVQTFNARPRQIIEKIRDAFMCEFYYDTINKIVYFLEELGEYKGAYLRRGLNLSKLSTTMDSYDYYTRILPIGKDGLRISSVNSGSNYLTNFQYSNKVRTFVWEDTSYESAASLKEDATKKLEDLSKPKISYSVEIRDLAKMSGVYSLLAFQIGDTVDIVDGVSGVRDSQRIVKLKEYPDNPTKNSCELSNTVLTFEELQDRLNKAADAWEEKTNTDGSIKGIYVHGVQADDVVYIEVEEGEEGEDPTITEVSMQDAVDGIVARVGTLEVTALTATTADIRYADIALANVTTLNAHNMYVRTGIIKSVQVGTEMVDFLDAVEIEADKITAGTLVADRILIKTQDGLLYALNNSGTTPSANTDTLDGQIITPASIKAVKIDVEDLFAQNITATGSITGATIAGTKGEIGGWDLLAKCLYSVTQYSGSKVTTVFQNADIEYAYTLSQVGNNGLLVEQWYTWEDEIVFFLGGVGTGYRIAISGNYLEGDATLETEAGSLTIDGITYLEEKADYYYSDLVDEWYIGIFNETYVATLLTYQGKTAYYCSESGYYITESVAFLTYENGEWTLWERSYEEAEIYAGLPEGATLSPAGSYSNIITVLNDIDAAYIKFTMKLPSAAAGETYQFVINVYDENNNLLPVTEFDLKPGIYGSESYSQVVEGLPKTAILAIKREEDDEDPETLFYVDKAGDMNAHEIYEGGTKLSSKYVLQSALLDMVYPVGAIYMSVNSTSPATLFGGTWEQLQNRFLLAAGSSYSAGATGGEATHTLTSTEIPAHTHGSKSLSGSFRLTNNVLTNDASSSKTRDATGIASLIGESVVTAYVGSNVSGSVNRNTGVTINATHTHDSVGGGDAHNNMPPYLVVYMWKRTA